MTMWTSDVSTVERWSGISEKLPAGVKVSVLLSGGLDIKGIVVKAAEIKENKNSLGETIYSGTVTLKQFDVDEHCGQIIVCSLGQIDVVEVID